VEDNKTLKTGTTTLAIVCKDGLVVAADRRTTAGSMVYRKTAKKIQAIEENHVVTTAGNVSDIQLTVKIIKAQIKLDEMRRGKKLMTKEIANLIAGLNYSALRATYAISSFLLAGKDERGLHVYDITPDGSIVEVDDYAGDGSGMMFTTGVFEANYRKDMNIEEGVKLAVKAMNAALQRDIYSGNGIDVITITSKGVKQVIDKELEMSIKI